MVQICTEQRGSFWVSEQNEYLSPREVEDDPEFRISRWQLANWRLLDLGPAYVKGPGKNGRVLYRRSSLRTFLAEHTVTPGRAA